MSLPPVEIPLGAMRFNSDSQKLEYWNGQIWMQIHTFNPDLDGGARGIIGGGSSYADRIEFITIPTAGNSTDFGDLSIGRMLLSGMSSRTRALFAGGRKSPGVQENLIDYVTISSTGDAADFGDLTKINEYASLGTIANATRGIIAGGENYSPHTDMGTEINYVTMASTGNAVKFGDLNVNVQDAPAGFASPIRGFVAGGGGPSGVTTIQYITIPTTGDATVFGDLSQARQGAFGVSNSTVGLVAGGYSGSDVNIIEKINMATLGDAVKFGDLSDSRRWGASICSPVRGVFAGGYAPGSVNTMDYCSIVTGGDCVDFGDQLDAKGGSYGGSNAHGGLG